MRLCATVFLLAVSTFAVGQATISSAPSPLPNEPTPAASQVALGTSSSMAATEVQDQAPSSAAQPPSNQSQPGQAQTDATTPEQKKPATSAEILKQEEHQRILGVVPNFNSVSLYGNVPPLSPGQKFHLVFKSTTDPVTFIGVAFVAGIGQADNSHPGFGQGAQGYGKRIGAAYADAADGALWGNAILPVLFKEDPRYFRMGEGPFKRRMLHAVTSTVWSKRDSGSWGPAYANILGNFIAGGISNVYYPADDRGFGTTIDGALTVTAEGAVGAMFVEFFPDIANHFHKKSQTKP